MAYIMEEISLFGATPSFRAIPAGGFVISASRIAGEAPPVAGGAFIPEEIRAQGLVESEFVVDLGVIPEASSNVDRTADHGAQAKDVDVSTADTLVGSDHLENIGELELLTSSLFFLVVECYIWKKFHFIWEFLFP
jgi:hypothetical protein